MYKGRTPEHNIKMQPDNYLRELNLTQYLPPKLHVIVEIGAYDCRDIITLYNIFQPDIAISVEAAPENWDMCRSNLNNAGLQDKIVFYDLAVSSENDRIIEFYAVDENDAAASVYKHKRLPPCITWSVKTITLDTICKQHNITSIDLLCMDTQGHEIEILKGSSNILSHIQYIALEIPHDDGSYIGQTSEQECRQFMSDNGFQLLNTFDAGCDYNLLYKKI